MGWEQGPDGKLKYVPDAPTGATDKQAQIGVDPNSGALRYFTIGANGQPVWGALAPPAAPTNPNPGHTTSDNTSTSTSTSSNTTPQVYQATDGSTHVFDPVSGQDRVIAPSGAMTAYQQAQLQNTYDIAALNEKGASGRTQAQIDATSREAAANRTATANEGAANRAQTTTENASNRTATAAESALTRALGAGEFAATLAQQRARDEMTADQNYQAAMAQYANDKVAGAKTVADLTNSVDPTALPAFYAAGGGNIGNSIAAGASAVSDKAVLPAAQALRANTERALPTRFAVDYTGVNFDPSKYSQPSYVAPVGGGAPSTVTAPVSVPTPYRADSTPGYTTTPSGGVSLNAGEISAASAAGAANGGWQATPGFASGTGARPVMRRFAMGSEDNAIPTGQNFSAIVGDSTAPDPAAGGAKPEGLQINDPTGDATVAIDPLTQPGVGDDGDGSKDVKFADVLRSIADYIDVSGGSATPGPAMPRRFAYGTDGVDDPFLNMQPGDESYMQQIRDIRTQTPYPILNPYSTKYRFNPTTVQQSYLMGEQGRYGVPVADQQQQIAQYAVPTASRGMFSMGV